MIETTLKELKYHVFSEIIDACHWVPQHRERVLIVCFDERVFGKKMDFEFPTPPAGKKPVMSDILDATYDQKYVLTDHLWKYLRDYAEKHRKKGNGFGYGLVGPHDQCRTMSARYHKDGSEILIKPPVGGHKNVTDPKRSCGNPRKLAPAEAARLMGFDEEMAAIFGHENGFPQVVSDTQAYRQFGNAVVTKVVEAVGRQIMPVLAGHLRSTGNGCLIKT